MDRLEMARLARGWQQHFQGDARYDLQRVTEGFAPRADDASDDTDLLKRICSAYARAVKDQEGAPRHYDASDWWQQVRSTSLGPVRKALLERDISGLNAMYRTFFRDSCADGLVGLPYGMTEAYLNGVHSDVLRHYYLGDVLHRIDYWTERTNGQFSIDDLSGPNVGNPFGIVLSGTLVRTGSEYQHYCAWQVTTLLNAGPAVVAEVGGGFGGMAYYLIRQRPTVTYINFDVPESLALAAYYLSKCFPTLAFVLYGEQELSDDTIAHADVMLMPLFALCSMPPGSAELMFSSHALADIGRQAMAEYLDRIVAMTTAHFLYIGSTFGATAIPASVKGNRSVLNLTATRLSEWNRHKMPNVREVERLYRVERT